MLEKNRLAFEIIKQVKENLQRITPPEYNPIILEGLNSGIRYRIFLSIFTKDLNRLYKDKYRYLSCDTLTIANIQNKKLIILENLEKIEDNLNKQKILYEVLDYCQKQNVQIVLCSDKKFENLKISISIKNKLASGLIITLKN